MSDILQTLVVLADALDQRNLSAHADAVDAVLRSVVPIKKAQYVGVQGYWIANSRCFGNCYRQKRAQSPQKAAQDVWMECWDEYQQGQKDGGEKWAKYAEEVASVPVKTASTLHSKFTSHVAGRVASGEDLATVINSTLNDQINLPQMRISEASSKLLDISKELATDHPDLSSRLAEASGSLIKETQWWNPFQQYGNWKNRREMGRSDKFIQRTNDLLSNILSKHPDILTNPALQKMYMPKIWRDLKRNLPKGNEQAALSYLGNSQNLLSMMQNLQKGKSMNSPTGGAAGGPSISNAPAGGGSPAASGAPFSFNPSTGAMGGPATSPDTLAKQVIQQLGGDPAKIQAFVHALSSATGSPGPTPTPPSPPPAPTPPVTPPSPPTPTPPGLNVSPGGSGAPSVTVPPVKPSVPIVPPPKP